MRLLQTTTLLMQDFPNDSAPAYVTLSHTWGSEEVTFEDFDHAEATQKAGYHKIKQFCEKAARHGHRWGWVDTCCIDKRSSSELTEAINSMFVWYKDAIECYAYLSDVVRTPTSSEGSPRDKTQVLASILSPAKWFTRGWTLQELIAPRKVVFFTRDWVEIGLRDSMSEVLAQITGIDESYLTGGDLANASIAKRMSWASGRTTTRPEDLAYCLFGLFDVNMPLLYGEGGKAFQRLQHEIMKTSDDESIFAWSISENNARSTADPTLSGLLAKSPADFARAGNIQPLTRPKSSEPFSTTNKGLRLQLPLLVDAADPHSYIGLLSCQYKNDFTGPVAVHLRRQPFMEDRFMRVASRPAFVFGADRAFSMHYRKPQSALSTIYVQDKQSASAEARQELHFQVLSVPSGFRITDGHPNWSWNEETHFLSAKQHNGLAKAVVQLEEEARMNRIVLMLAVRPGNVGQIGSATSFHLKLVHRDRDELLEDVCNSYRPGNRSWFVERGEAYLSGIIRQDQSKARLLATIEETIVLGLQVYQVVVKTEAVHDIPPDQRRTGFVQWIADIASNFCVWLLSIFEPSYDTDDKEVDDDLGQPLISGATVTEEEPG